jgi:hypothetical protein
MSVLGAYWHRKILGENQGNLEDFKKTLENRGAHCKYRKNNPRKRGKEMSRK